MKRADYVHRPMRRSRLYRNTEEGRIFGVCAGIADYFGLDPWVVRIGAIVGFFMFTLPTVFAYAIAAWWIDPAPEDLYETQDERGFWRDVRTEPSGTVHSLRHRFRDLERRLRRMEAFVTSREFGLRRDIDGLDT